MRIVIDMQGAQTENRFLAIGLNALSFAQAIIRNRGDHEILLALNGLFPETIELIRTAFDGILPQENVRVWRVLGPLAEAHADNDARRNIAELAREAFLASLRPNIIHISSLFEGYLDNAITSIGRFDTTTLVSIMLHGPISRFGPERHLLSDPSYAAYCQRKVDYLKKAVICLESPDSTGQENVKPPHQEQAFLWDEMARHALARWETLYATQARDVLATPLVGRKPRLAFVSPLPPERSGIAYYSTELLPALADYYDIDVVVEQTCVDDVWVNAHCVVRDVAWLRDHACEVDRVVYQVGNSPFHAYMLPLLQQIPGTVVLHDFYLSDLMAWQECVAVVPYALCRALYLAHGYGAVRERYRDTESAIRSYPANFGILQAAKGVVVHSNYSQQLIQHWYGKDDSRAIEVIPLLRSATESPDKVAARLVLGFAADDFVICSFGILGPTKLNHRLLAAWLGSALKHDKKCHLVFVGENNEGEYGANLTRTIKASGLGTRILITGFVSAELFHQYLTAADMAVQLRTHSRGETSAAVLDCMNHKLPLIVNANGSMAELDPEAVWMLPDEFDNLALIDAIEVLWRSPVRRQSMGARGHEVVSSKHNPAECARRYAYAIERFHYQSEASSAAIVSALVGAISTQQALSAKKEMTDAELMIWAANLSANLPLPRSAKRLFLDISATCRNDLKTGIERVARALLLALLDAPPDGFRVEPVYLSDAGGAWHYRSAHHYTLSLLSCPPDVLYDDEPVEPACGDVLLGLDFSGDLLVQATQAGLLADWRAQGVLVYFMVHDLLPIRLPEVFPPGADEGYAKWTSAIAQFDGAICVSKSVAEDLALWREQTELEKKARLPFRICWSHHGSDVSNSAPSQGFPNSAKFTLRQLQARPSFLMVGTIEPRKGYLETIEAFSQLWNEGIDANLVIVGNEGWKLLPDAKRRDIPETIHRLNAHPELNKRLFWLNGISDEYLEKVYSTSTCLIAASYGEGFGLPLIEAAQHNLPIIARDIPVLREVAGECAWYFGGKENSDIAQSVKKWLRAYAEHEHPSSGEMRVLTWKESSTHLGMLLKKSSSNNFSSHFGELLNTAPKKKLYVDISVVWRDDFRTGIQRVVRAILSALVLSPPKDFIVCPVYLSDSSGIWEYRTVQTYSPVNQDNSIFPKDGDVLLGLDLAGGYVVAASQQGLYRKLADSGLQIYFVVYDLIPVLMPKFFDAESSKVHGHWLQCISESNGVACISKAVADEFSTWAHDKGIDLPSNFLISHFHLGADISASDPTRGLPDDVELILGNFRSRLSFLMVGTIEARKGHPEVLAAFENLWWNQNQDFNLIIVGKKGWMVESVIEHILSHPELNKRLFWLEGISDEYLEKVYANSTCLIAASYGEGFGLPLIEAAQHKLPVIARDIPVFREVASDHAFYFSGTNPMGLGAEILDWLQLYAGNRHPQSDVMPWLTWKQSTESLLRQVLSCESTIYNSNII